MNTKNFSNRSGSGVALGALFASVAATSCGQNSTEFALVSPEEVGSMQLALAVSGLDVDSVTVEIASEDLVPAVVRTRTFSLSDQNASVSARESALTAGTYEVSLSAHVLDNPATVLDESETQCSGAVRGVVVTAGAVTEVSDLVLQCVLDGGQVQVAGGLRVTAETQLTTVNQCSDLFAKASIAPLDTSVGGQVALSLEPINGATVRWSANRGTVSADGTSYWCPDIPGEYTVTATVTTPEGCTRTLSEVVTCHSDYEGTCNALPSAFVWEGSCGLRSPCHLLTQDGCAWTASCRGQAISGEATSATSFPFAYSRGDIQFNCNTELVNGELVGTCDDGTQSCSLQSNQLPVPSATCAHVLDLPSVSACGVSAATCDVVQDGCTYQARCEDGTVRTGGVDGDTLRWDIDDRSTTGERYRCQAPMEGSFGTGTCARRDGEGPESCEFSAEAKLLDSGGCAETLPTAGFKLEGCGLDGVAFANQRECIWEIVSEAGAFSGESAADNAYQFANPAGQACSGVVVDGTLSGTCGAGESQCSFGTVQTASDASCLQLPEVVATRGCGFGAPTAFRTVQDGCEFYAYAPSRGVFVAGEATANGVTFPGIAEGWLCTAVITEEVGDELWGECIRNNEDGSVSQCRDFTDRQGSRLVIGLSP